MASLRERWGSRTLFIFAAVGSAVGLGNVWRFPYLTYEYGGGAFLIPWVISIVVVGIPWLMMEFGIGRYFQRSAPGVFEAIGKKWEWLGWWPAFMAFLIVCYYAVILAWSLRYTISSITMAWGTGQAGVENTGNFFYNDILQLSSGPGILGSPVWLTVLMLAIVWVAIFFIIYRGAKITGKIAVWTVIIPWALLVILAVRGLTLPGAAEGLNFYLSPDFSELGNAEVWFAAVSQVAFSLSVGMAGMFAYGSWIAKKADVSNNTVITAFSDSATAFFAGFAVFSTLGFLAQSLSVPISEVANSGLGLAFVTFPAAISMMPAANALLGVVFFFALFFLGIDSAFFLAHGGVVAPLMDKFGWGRFKTTLGVCLVCFVAGLLFCTQGGLYWLDIIDRATSFYGLLITGLLATIIVGWVFGADKLRQHLNETSDIKVGAWWNWLIKLVVPAGILLLLITGGFMEDLKTPYGGYPAWAANMIWVTLGVTLVISFILGRLKTKGPKEEG